MIISCGGDGTFHEIINGYYNREAEGFFGDRLLLRMGVLLGGSACCSAYTPVKEWGLASKNQINNLYVLIRSRFKPVTIMNLQTNTSEVPIYSFHSIAMGYTSENIRISQGYRYAGEGRYKIAAYMNLFFYIKPRGMKITLVQGNKKKEINFDMPFGGDQKHQKIELPFEMPFNMGELSLNDPIPQSPDVTVHETKIYDCIVSQYPDFSEGLNLFSGMEWGANHANVLVTKGDVGWGGLLKA